MRKKPQWSLKADGKDDDEQGAAQFLFGRLRAMHRHLKYPTTAHSRKG
jgi:hypothetical protein